MSSEPTRFTEANALLAIQSGEPESALEKIRTLTPHELLKLREAAYDLGEMCAKEMTRII